MKLGGRIPLLGKVQALVLFLANCSTNVLICTTTYDKENTERASKAKVVPSVQATSEQCMAHLFGTSCDALYRVSCTEGITKEVFQTFV